MISKKWVVSAKKADFDAWAAALHISPLTARLIRNRGIMTIEEADRYLNGTVADLHDPARMKDLPEAAAIITEAVRCGRKIAVVTDYDDDGIFSGEILYEGIGRLGGVVSLYTPERKEGYGINEAIIRQAKADGCTLLITCDNGIAALREISYAKELGFTVIVTDHHDVQYETEGSEKKYLLPEADAVIDPKRADSDYPFRELCGAGVVLRLIQYLCRSAGIGEEADEILYAYAAIATVADVVALTGENRLIVRKGLEVLRETSHAGLSALMEACELKREKLSSYYLGFVLGPCFNAVGRLSHVRQAFDLLQEQDPEKATVKAGSIRELNEKRKKMTEDGTQEAVETVEKSAWKTDSIYLVRVEKGDESVAGIIAGRLKERYGRPVYVFADTGSRDAEGKRILKGSGRSIPAYPMLDGLLPFKELMLKFGGHKMAAGLSVTEDRLEELRTGLNGSCGLTAEDLVPVVTVDMAAPLSCMNEELIREIEKIQPTGTENPEVRFARPHFRILSMRRIGKESGSLKMNVTDGSVGSFEALLFHRADEFLSFLSEEFGDAEVEKAFSGLDNGIDVAFLYNPEINEFRDVKTLQIICQDYCRIR